MNYLSVCSGIEAATVAWHDLGWNPLGFSEIENFPSEVLAHHYPNVPNLGDMTKFKEWDFGTNRLDLLVGGTPCQSFSVAGLRKGLDDPRGNLALTYVAILDKFRPKWCVWENVPGVLSSGGGRDFGSFLGALAELGYGWSYRVLDAQNFGVPQRRRRVFVVGHLGDWKPSAKVLFESESLSWNIKKSREKREAITGYVESSFGQYREDGIAGTLKRSGGVAAGGSETFITHCAKKFPTLLSSTAGVSRPGNTATEHETYIALQDISARDKFQNGKGWSNEGKSYTVDTQGLQGVAIGVDIDNTSITSEISGTLCAEAQSRTNKGMGVMQSMLVRRLTPVECERLQGFPDNYTNIKENCPDGPRYKAIGNSMAVPVMKWIGKRIELIEK